MLGPWTEGFLHPRRKCEGHTLNSAPKLQVGDYCTFRVLAV